MSNVAQCFTDNRLFQKREYFPNANGRFGDDRVSYEHKSWPVYPQVAKNKPECLIRFMLLRLMRTGTGPSEN